jgi:hypothetical protein
MKIHKIENEKKDIDNPSNGHMPQEHVHEIVVWLRGQVRHLSAAIARAKESKNYGREAQYQGMRDAFVRCLNRLSNQQYWN